jgi:hypothetical protein
MVNALNYQINRLKPKNKYLHQINYLVLLYKYVKKCTCLAYKQILKANLKGHKIS